jgi:hypothetical protein
VIISTVKNLTVEGQRQGLEKKLQLLLNIGIISVNKKRIPQGRVIKVVPFSIWTTVWLFKQRYLNHGCWVGLSEVRHSGQIW